MRSSPSVRLHFETHRSQKRTEGQKSLLKQKKAAILLGFQASPGSFSSFFWLLEPSDKVSWWHKVFKEANNNTREMQSISPGQAIAIFTHF